MSLEANSRGLEAPSRSMVVVCGSRDWIDYSLIHSRLSKLPKDTVIVEGDNGRWINGKLHGADKIAGRVAKELGLGHIPVPANWNALGRAAGPIRNRQMLDMKPVLVIAFHDDLEKSLGTADTVREAKRRGIPVEVIGHLEFLGA